MWCIARATPSSGARSRSRCCRRTSPSIPNDSRASSARRGCWRRSTIRNIATVYGFEQAEATHFLTMEVVEGATLADASSAARFLSSRRCRSSCRSPRVSRRRTPRASSTAISSRPTSRSSGGRRARRQDPRLRSGEGARRRAAARVAARRVALTDAHARRRRCAARSSAPRPTCPRSRPRAARRRARRHLGVRLLSARGAHRQRPFGGANASRVLASVLKDEPDSSALPPDLPRRRGAAAAVSREESRRPRAERGRSGESSCRRASLLPPGSDRRRKRRAKRLAIARHCGLNRRVWLLLGSTAALIGLAGLAVDVPRRPEATPSEQLGHTRAGGPASRRRDPLRPRDRAPTGHLTERPSHRLCRRRCARIDLYLQDLGRGGAVERGHRDERVVGSVLLSGRREPWIPARWHPSRLSERRPAAARSVVGGLSLTGGNATWERDGGIYYGDATGGIDRVPAAGGGSPQSLKSASTVESYDNLSLLPGGRYVLQVGNLGTSVRRVNVSS